MKRIVRQFLTVSGIAMLFLVLQSCSGNPSVSTGIGIHRSPNGDWGHSINIGIHSHGRNW
jgi:hypothetical protein